MRRALLSTTGEKHVLYGHAPVPKKNILFIYVGYIGFGAHIEHKRLVVCTHFCLRPRLSKEKKKI
jgi:hypothetical protein